jgi:hypothetical protein
LQHLPQFVKVMMYQLGYAVSGFQILAYAGRGHVLIVITALAALTTSVLVCLVELLPLCHLS